MSWNYRFIRHKKHHDGSYPIQLHEVYYDHEGNPASCTMNPVNIFTVIETMETHGEDQDEAEELAKLKEMIVAAFDKPVLDMELFEG